MRHNNIFLAFIFLIATGLLVFYGVAVLSPTQTQEQSKNAQGLTALDRPKIDFGNPRRGAEKPVVTIVEYGDYQCEPCSQMDADLQKILQDFPTKVAVVWKDFPNSSIHPAARGAAEAARCAGEQGAFWQYHDTLLANQDAISADNFSVFGTQIGIDGTSVASCVDAKTMSAVVGRDLEEALRLQITATPTIFIGDRRIEGVVGYDRLRSLVESAIAETENTPTTK